MRFLLFIAFLFSATGLRAQVGLTAPGVLRGTVTDAVSGEALAAVTVVNTATNQSTFTDASGSFAITARPGQRIAFTYVGYKPQEIAAPEAGNFLPQQIVLQRRSYQLSEYIVRPKYTPYQADSIARHSTYQRVLAREKVRSLGSPVTLLADKISKKSKQIYRFQKEFSYWEGQRYIDTRYSPELVAQLTHLSGDTLAHFMNAYPMPYDYARTASELELKMWIRTNYREWLKKAVPAADSLMRADTAGERH